MNDLPSILKEQGFLRFLAGFACLHAWIHATVTAPVYSLHEGNFFVFSVSNGTLLATLIIIVLCASWVSRFIDRAIWSVAFATIAAIGTLLLSNSLPLIPSSLPLTIGATALTALGTGGLLAIWGEVYARFTSTYALVLATFAALIASSFIYLLVNSFPEHVALFIVALLPIGSFLCAHNMLAASSAKPHASGGGRQGPRQPLPKKLLAYILAFSVPLNFLNLQISSGGLNISQSSWSLVYSCALMVVALALMTEILLRRRNVTLLAILTVVLATVSLLYYTLADTGDIVLTSVFMYSGYYLFIATFYSHLGALTHRRGRRPFVIFIIGNIVNVLGLLIGTLIGFAVSSLTPPWIYIVTMVIVYALFFIGFLLMPQWRQNFFSPDDKVEDERDDTPPTLADCVESHCSAVARKVGLTPREEEVLNYLVRGRSVQSIAKATILSVNTVKTHTHHIHQKLAVHTREELIILVEQLGKRS